MSNPTKNEVVARYKQAAFRVDKTDGALCDLRADLCKAEREVGIHRGNLAARESQMVREKAEVAFYNDLLLELGFTEKEIKWEL